MADKSERSNESVEMTLEEMKKLLTEKAKKDGEISMKEISDKLALYEIENEEIFHFAELLDGDDNITVEGKEAFEEEA